MSVSDGIAVEEIRDTAAALCKVVNSFLVPPIVELAASIKLPPVVIEPVTHLVPQHAADAAEVPGFRVRGIEERRLQYASWDPQAVVVGAVERVHVERRASSPLSSVRLFKNPSEVTLDRESADGHVVDKEVWAHVPVHVEGFHRPVRLPLLVSGPGNLEEHLPQLLLRSLAVLSRHPVLVLKVLHESAANLLEHFKCRLPVLLVEGLVGVQLRSRPGGVGGGAVVALARTRTLLRDAIEIVVHLHHEVNEIRGQVHC
mmetsp:Transcript_45828/g.143771  ORF Transcript_45828/g.143771 Transcript_45828/m.143771 type:complete len:258 (-) Transcript_45828:1208-1981(-)